MRKFWEPVQGQREPTNDTRRTILEKLHKRKKRDWLLSVVMESLLKGITSDSSY